MTPVGSDNLACSKAGTWHCSRWRSCSFQSWACRPKLRHPKAQQGSAWPCAWRPRLRHLTCVLLPPFLEKTKTQEKQKVTHLKKKLESPGPHCLDTLSCGHYRTLYDEFIRLLFLHAYHAYREASVLANEFPEESDQFRFLRSSCFVNLMTKVSSMWISIPLDLSSRSSIPLPRFIRLCRPTPLLVPSLVLFPPCSV